MLVSEARDLESEAPNLSTNLVQVLRCPLKHTGAGNTHTHAVRIKNKHSWKPKEQREKKKKP